MSASFFYRQVDKTPRNHEFIEELERYCVERNQQAYVVNRPLGDAKYQYVYDGAIAVLMPKHKIAFIDFGADDFAFQEYCEDFIEDLGSIADKYRYKEAIGRPRNWTDLIEKISHRDIPTVQNLLGRITLADPSRQRVCELLISLVTGSINDIEAVKATIPQNLLDKVKQKIQLFDGDQTRFIYERITRSPIRIQGLSGTGKTELLLHKLKELYIEKPDSAIIFTCHNKILAADLRRRIPDFFNFMKVEQQIKWHERLWCIHAWGSQNNANSGTYRLICERYDLPFETYGPSFATVCQRALDAIRKQPNHPKHFDYILIDESQDFPEVFFDLCKEVTKSTVYIAGDVFQSIFDETAKYSVEPDFLLSKCYRTDPRTLMFAHALGMGLFEQHKLRWLEEDEWRACGYIVAKRGPVYQLSREPLRRFEDINRDELNSVEILETADPFYVSATGTILSIIHRIRAENPTVCPDDVGVIILDSNKAAYALADTLEQTVPREVGWSVNKAYETKTKIRDRLFVSNQNNVKGLEFPFVICVTAKIYSAYGYRNALYMTLTRSFLQTYLVLSGPLNEKLIDPVARGLDVISRLGRIEIEEPSEPEKEAIRTTIKHKDASVSLYDLANKVFEELDVLPIFREVLLDTVKNVAGDDVDYDNIKEIVAFNYERMQRGSK